MTSEPLSRRDDRTPCLLYPAMIARGGGLTRSLQERATLLASHYERVLIFTTGFAPQTDKVVAELKARGGLDERVEVRNFFAHSRWVAQLGVPPQEARDPDRGNVVTKAQGLQKGRPLRLADTQGRHASPSSTATSTPTAGCCSPPAPGRRASTSCVPPGRTGRP